MLVDQSEKKIMDPMKGDLPSIKNLTTENITENFNLINSFYEDRNMKYVLERLVTHLDSFARETRLSSKEWIAGLLFLTEVGKICTDVRQVRVLVLSFLPLFHCLHHLMEES
jgi:hypothetical protein